MSIGGESLGFQRWVGTFVYVVWVVIARGNLEGLLDMHGLG